MKRLFLDGWVYDWITSGQWGEAERAIRKRMSPATVFEDYHEIYMLVNVTEVHYYCLRVHGVHDNYTIDEVDSGTGGRGKARKHAKLKDFFLQTFVNETNSVTVTRGGGTKHNLSTKKLFTSKSLRCQKQDNAVDCLLYSLMWIELNPLGLW